MNAIADRGDRYEIIEGPHGRALYVIVEEDGIYVGKEFVPFLLFDRYLRDNGPTLRPDCAIVLGTDSVRYGKVVEVYDRIRSIYSIHVSLPTRPVPTGTRRGAIEVHEHFWQY